MAVVAAVYRGKLEQALPFSKHLPLIIKNTFLDIDEPNPDLRRCASVPPSLRRSTLHMDDSDDDTAPIHRANTFPCVPEQRQTLQRAATASERSERWSEVSTTELSELERSRVHNDFEEETSSDGSAPGPERLISKDSMPETPEARPTSTLNPHAPEWSPSSYVGSPVIAAPAIEPFLEPSCAVADLTYPVTPHRLSSRAQAWQPVTPAAIVPAPTKAPPTFSLPSSATGTEAYNQFQAYATQVKEDLACDRHIAKVDINIECERMSIVLTVSSQDSSRNTQQALKAAQFSLKRAAEQSVGVYVLGYAAKPFWPSSFGFTGSLGFMEDEGTACWNYFMKGTCRHTNSCRFQHPSSRLAIDVTVEVPGAE